jgi:hypothetical protein
MRLSLLGCASVVALGAFALAGNGAIAAPKGQGCDLRGVPGSGCQSGKLAQPSKMHAPEKSRPTAAVSSRTQTLKPGGTDQPPPPHPQ